MFRPLASVLDFALPPRCPGCGAIVESDGRFCGACWRSLDFLAVGGCVSCGLPIEALPGSQCATCIADPPAHDGVRAAVAYGPVARALVLKLKHGRKPGLARIVAGHMAAAAQADAAALLVPVPLHRWRIWARGYNQAALIATRIGTATAVPVALDALRRVKPTPLLRGLGRKDRARAVRGVFAVPAQARTLLRGRHVMLVDDVYTSGATANACARALKRAGAARVTVHVWARVVRDEAGY